MRESREAYRAIKAISLILIPVLAISTSIAFVEAQTAVRVFWDDFEDYEVKTYSGSAGPGPWLQSIGGGGSTTYEVISSSGSRFYSLDSSDASSSRLFSRTTFAYSVYASILGLMTTTSMSRSRSLTEKEA